MNRSHYTFAIIFLVLGIASSLFQSHLYFRLDNQLFIQKSFINWFLVTNIVGLAGSLFLLKYFHFKKYDFTFKTATVVTFAIVCQSIVLYTILAAGKLQAFYLPIAFLIIIAAIVLLESLIFSEAGKRPWLKTGGIFILIVGLVLRVCRDCGSADTGCQHKNYVAKNSEMGISRISVNLRVFYRKFC